MRHMKRVLLLLFALMLAAPCAPAVRAETASKKITNKCKFRVSEGSAKLLHDGKLKTEWTYSGKGAQVEIAIPPSVTVGGMLVCWTFEPEDYEIIEYDAENAEIALHDSSETFPCITAYQALQPETKYVRIKCRTAGQGIAEIRVYSEGTPQSNLQTWEAPVEKADFMLVSTHQDDEELFFGGAIPYYAVAQKCPTVVVYMANCTRMRRQEALNGLWAMGVRNYPEFINLADKSVPSISEGISYWGGEEKILGELVQRIRRYKPEVIATHDFNGEYGHNQHKITARMMPKAIEKAADGAQYPESAAQFGAWQVKKLYIHLYKENAIRMDWDTPLEALGGKTALEVAKIGFAEHKSQQKYYSMDKAGVKYDNRAFGLYASTVGADVKKNDFFENLSAAKAPKAAEPTAEPTNTPEPTEAPEAEPKETPPLAEASEESGGNSLLPFALLGGAVLTGGAAFAALRGRRKRRRRRR
jgi:LmbE family N-acetylglucosaminyl deacetylase